MDCFAALAMTGIEQGALGHSVKRHLLTAICLALATSAHALAAPASEEIAPGACKTVPGAIYLSADDGIVLDAGKVGHYQVNTAPVPLMQRTPIRNLVDGVSGTFKICATPNHDRFGSQMVNILSYRNLSFNPPPG
jgi:hypothetical protein